VKYDLVIEFKNLKILIDTLLCVENYIDIENLLEIGNSNSFEQKYINILSAFVYSLKVS
jgi:hypothetical protein